MRKLQLICSLQKLLSMVNVHDRETMRKLIREYSSAKSAGGDGTHAVVIKNLLGSPFAEHLSALYGYFAALANRIRGFGDVDFSAKLE